MDGYNLIIFCVITDNGVEREQAELRLFNND